MWEQRERERDYRAQIIKPERAALIICVNVCDGKIAHKRVHACALHFTLVGRTLMLQINERQFSRARKCARDCDRPLRLLHAFQSVCERGSHKNTYLAADWGDAPPPQEWESLGLAWSPGTCAAGSLLLSLTQLEVAFVRQGNYERFNQLVHSFFYTMDVILLRQCVRFSLWKVADRGSDSLHSFI